MSRKFKILLGLLTVLIGLFIVALILPFVIDLNRFKPQIQNMVSNQVNAKIDFSSVQLTVLSGLGFTLNDVSVENTDTHFLNTKVLQVKEIKFKTKILPLLSGKIIGRVDIDSPNIKLIKDGEINNAASLIKKDKQVNQTENNNQVDAFNPPSERDKLPPQGLNKESTQLHMDPAVKPLDGNNVAKNILIESFIIKNANISYLDLQNKKGPFLIQKLNIDISNIGLDKDVQIILSTHIDAKEKDYHVKGPISLKLVAKTSMESSKWENSAFNGELNLDDLSINFKDTFVKSNVIPFHFNFKGIATQNSLLLDNFVLDLQDLKSEAKIKVQDFKKLKSEITFSLYSKDVSSLGSILPQHKALLTKGSFNLSSTIHGYLSDINSINSSTKLTANLYNSDLRLFVNESSIEPLKGQLNVQSHDLKLGQILKPFMTSSSQKNTNANVINFEKIELHNFLLNSSASNNIANVQNLNFDIFDGNLASNLIVHLGEAPLVYSGNMKFKHIQIQDLIKLIQLKEQSPLEGVADLSFNFNGKGYTREALFKTLNAKGNFAFNTGKLNIKSIMAVTSEQLQKYAANIHIPGVNGAAEKLKSIDLGQNNQRSLKDAKGDFEIKNGKIIIDNNILSDQGDMKLNATVGLDESLGGTALYTASKSVNDQIIAQDKNFAYLFNNKGELQLNLILGGTLENPSVHIDLKNLQDNILHNTSKLLREKVSEQIKNQIKNNPQAQKVEEGAKKLLKENGLDLSKFGF